MLPRKRAEIAERQGKDLAQAVRIRLSEDMTIGGVYISPGINPNKMNQILEETHSFCKPEMIVVGDFNARHISWDKSTNNKGRALIRFAKKYNMVINPTTLPSFRARGRSGDSKPDLLLARMKSTVSQSRNKVCDDTSDHTPIIYEIAEINIRGTGKRIITKTMLNNTRNEERAREFYESRIPEITEYMKKASELEAQQLYNRATETILEPWQRIADAKPRVMRPHWKKRLDNLKKRRIV